MKMTPKASITTRSCFTVGSTKDEVLAAQGTPSELGDRMWSYGLSRVYFESGRVVSWRNSGYDELKVKMEEVRVSP